MSVMALTCRGVDWVVGAIKSWLWRGRWCGGVQNYSFTQQQGGFLIYIPQYMLHILCRRAGLVAIVVVSCLVRTLGVSWMGCGSGHGVVGFDYQ